MGDGERPMVRFIGGDYILPTIIKTLPMLYLGCRSYFVAPVNTKTTDTSIRCPNDLSRVAVSIESLTSFISFEVRNLLVRKEMPVVMQPILFGLESHVGRHKKV